MKQSQFTLETSRQLTGGIWELVLSGDTSAITAPGQFVNIALPGKFLRRPISVCDWAKGRLTLLVREAGSGTAELVRMAPGTALDVLSGLGNGFDLTAAPDEAVLVGGGVGIAPLHSLARRMLEAGLHPRLALGFRTEADALPLMEFFSDLICPLEVSTEDGSLGARGFVTGLLPRDAYVLACGPTPMLRAVWNHPRVIGGQFSFEARMACGFGACVGCTIQTANGPRRVCRDGPVFAKEEIVW